MPERTYITRVHQQFNTEASVDACDVLDYVISNTGEANVFVGRTRIPVPPGTSVSLGNPVFPTKRIQDIISFSGSGRKECHVYFTTIVDQ